MACVSPPTRTVFTTITSVAHSTSISATVSTVPDTVSSAVVVSCTVLGIATECVTNTRVTTIPAALSTVEVPFTVDVPVTVTQPIQTLFASCSDSSSSMMSSSTSFSISQSTPPPTTITSEASSTLADGSVVVQFQTITSTLPATAVYVPTVVPVSQQHSNNPSHSVNLGPIIGGVIGGFFGLISIVAVLWLFMRKRPSWGDIFEAEDPYVPTSIRSTRDKKRRIELDLDIQPKPYQYGLVGQVQSATLTSPPGSPTSIHPPLSNHAPSWHGRQRSSLTPLLVPSSASTPGASMRTTASSRPSTAGSLFPLRPPSQHGPHSSMTRTAMDEFGAARPVSAQSQPQISSWSRGFHPAPLIPLNKINDRPSSAPAEGPNRLGSPVSFHEPRRALQIVNAPLSPTASLESTTDTSGQPNELGSSQIPSPLGPNGGQPRTSSKVDPEVIVTTPSGPPSYEA